LPSATLNNPPSAIYYSMIADASHQIM